MIQVQDLVRVFHGRNESVRAVDGVSFHVDAGEVYGLLGPNGAGKTTTLRIIMGLLRPSSGSVAVNGIDVSGQSQSVKRAIGLVSASAGVYQWLTVREMLLFFADMYGLDEGQAEQSLENLAEVFDLKRILSQRCGTLSTGQKQRLSLARALIHDPPVLLLDEPTRGLDVMGTQVVFDYLQFLRERSKAVILSTHRLDEAERLCDRFGLLHVGQLVHQGTLAELRAATGKERLVEMFISLSRPDEAAQTSDR